MLRVAEMTLVRAAVSADAENQVLVSPGGCKGLLWPLSLQDPQVVTWMRAQALKPACLGWNPCSAAFWFCYTPHASVSLFVTRAS
jgi:hypothetical protein